MTFPSSVTHTHAAVLKSKSGAATGKTRKIAVGMSHEIQKLNVLPQCTWLVFSEVIPNIDKLKSDKSLYRLTRAAAINRLLSCQILD